MTQSYEAPAADTLRPVSASTSETDPNKSSHFRNIVDIPSPLTNTIAIAKGNRLSCISDGSSSEDLCNGSINQSASFPGSKSVIGADGVPSPKYHHLEHKPNGYGADFGVPSPSSSIIDVTDIGRRLSESVAITSKNDANSYELKPISQIKNNNKCELRT